MFHIAVGHHDLSTIQHQRRILIRQIRRIQKDGVVFLNHSRSKLIHDTAVHAVKIILRILADLRQINITHLESIQVSQIETCQHFQRCRRRQSRTIGNIAV